MITLLSAVGSLLSFRVRSRLNLELELVALRHQVTVLRRQRPGQPRLFSADRLLWVWLYRVWRWRSRGRVGRPKVSHELCALIAEMSQANPLWGSPRIHGELLKLGFDVAQSTVAKYMVRRRGPPSQGWKAFLHNHAPDIGAIDMFVVPTIGFKLLYGLVIITHHRRRLVWINVTTNPTAEWIAQQITEAFPWDQAPRYLIRDRDASYGHAATRRLAAMGIRDRPTAPRSPWQNGHIERLRGDRNMTSLSLSASAL